MALVSELHHYLKRNKINTKDFPSDAPLLPDPDSVLRVSLLIPGGHSEVRYQTLLQCVEHRGMELLLLCGYSRHLAVPTQVQHLIQEYLNEKNKATIAGKGTWGIYMGKQGVQKGLAEIGLVTSLIVGQWSAELFQQFFASAISRINEDFNSLSHYLLSIYDQDRDFRRKHDKFEKQSRTLKELGLSTHSKSILQLTDIATKALLSLDFPSPKTTSGLYENTQLIYSESALFGPDPIVISWVISIDLCLIEVHMQGIHLNEREITFANASSRVEVWNYISRTASDNPEASFMLSSSNSLHFFIKAVHCSLAKEERFPYVKMLIESARTIVKKGLQPLLKIHSDPVLEEDPVEVEQPRLRSSEVFNTPKNVQDLRQSLTKAVWAKYFLPTVPEEQGTVRLEDHTAVRLSQQDQSNSSGMKEFMLEIAAEGLYFHKLPLQCVYSAGGRLKLAPFFNAADISSSSLREDYVAFVNTSVSKWFSSGNSLPSIVYIDGSSFAHQIITDPIKRFGTSDIIRYHNRLYGENVLLRPVATKVLEQAGSLMSLSHPNISKVIGMTMYINKHFIVTEYASTDLPSHLKADFRVETRLALVRKIAEVLDYLHENEQFHLSLRPESVLITSDGLVKVTDFGIFPGKIENNPAEFLYAPPELLNPPKDTRDFLWEKVDIWAFGLLMHYILLPRTEKFQYAHFRQNMPKQDFLREISLWRRRPLIPPEFEQRNPGLVHLMRSCLYQQPKHRPSIKRALEVLAQLQAA